MPFKLRLTKSKQQYNVASKSMFVLTVELLDNAMLECTLTAENTGRECMENVCQRLNLNQQDLFGLRYVSRKSYPRIRWVDLDRPLKKQLDKYAQDPYLYLSVMFYVNDVSLLEDEVTRYHYFLQLKMDVIEGRLRCNYEQAIVLASYSLQAEFGDHDPEKHTLEYLQDFPLLPKPMLSQFPGEKRGTLTEAIIQQHASLRGNAQQLAEVYYIVGAQQLDGYGQECFLAKDESGNEVLIGASLTGIVVRKGNVLSPQFFKWAEITNLINHKQTFGIECQNPERSVQFLLDEADSAKYVWKMCVLQHSFYKMHASASESDVLNITVKKNQPTTSMPHIPPPSNTIPPPQHYDMILDQANILPIYPTNIQHSEIQNFQQQTQSIDLTPMKIHGNLGNNMQHLQQRGSLNHHLLMNQSQNMTLDSTLQHSYSKYTIQQHSNNSVNNLGNDMTPTGQFRPVPDYETAIRNKYGVMAAKMVQQQQQHPQQHQLQPSQLYNSQPSLVTDALIQQQQNQQQYSANIIENHYQNNQQIQQLQLEGHQHQMQTAYSSTPELNRMNLNSQIRHHGLQGSQHNHFQSNEEKIAADMQRLNLYKPPPPYPGPYTKLSSTSTPDLAGIAHNQSHIVGMGGSSPDLVSRRNLPAHHVSNKIVDTNIHKTFDNLHNINGSSTNVEYSQAYSNEELSSARIPVDKNSSGLNMNSKSANNKFSGGNFVAFAKAMSSDSCNEPIYQNQQQLLDEIEPIYQNLPIHEKALFKQRLLEQQQQQQQQQHQQKVAEMKPNAGTEPIAPLVDETVNSAEPILSTMNPSSSTKNHNNGKLKGHVSRVAITNSRENLHHPGDSNINFVYDEDFSSKKQEFANLPQKQKKSVTKINIGAAFETKAETSDSLMFAKLNQPLDMNPNIPMRTEPPQHQQELPADTQNEEEIITKSKDTLKMKKEDLTQRYIPDPNNHLVRDSYSTSSSSMIHNVSSNKPEGAPKTPSSKPRAGRKRWALNFGSKTGSLKSIKSESGSHKSQDSLDGNSSVSKASSSGFGPMMLATFHGLTRSRPDLLAESMATFSQPSKMPKDEIGLHLEQKLVEGEVLREFECIPKKKMTNCNFSVATQAENLTRSRFKDVLPYDENRVKLSAYADKDNKTGFINASHVSASVGPDQRFYIAAQGPLPNTVLHFWQMIFQCDVHLIIMLTDVSAATKTSSCIPYWPQKNGSSLEIGDFKIVKKFTESRDGSYTTSTLQVTHLPSKKQRTLWHLQYTDWSNHGCPSDVNKFIEFLEEMSALRHHTASEIPPGRNRNPPILLHCSAGVGRTGVTILCDILLYCIDHNLDIDIPKVLTHLRQQRMLMVQTIAQYKFVHTVLIHYLKQSRLI